MVCQAMSIAITVVFAGTRRQFQSETLKLRMSILVGAGEVFEESFAGFAGLRCDLDQPDHGFNRFDLTQKRADIAEIVVPPML
jgi:hypothetical protein